MSVPDAVTVLNQASLTFCVDTNLLVEFKPLEVIPWHELAPNATEIRIIVPIKVGEEMDAHKRKMGRLRRRGLEFAKLARMIEESPDQVAEVRAAHPRVTVEFGPVFRRTELDGDLYELDDDDGRVVAEVAKIMEIWPQAIFLSDDAKPLRLAKQTGLLRQRPIETWRREEGPDDRDLEIADLRRALGPQPALVVTFPRAENDRREHIVEPPPEAICAICVDGLVEAALSVHPQASRDGLVQKYGITPRDPFGLSSLFASGLTPAKLDEYEADHRSFMERVRSWAQHLPSLLRAPGTILPITIAVGNEGDRAAERVHVEAELHGSFHFAPLHLFDDLLEDFLEPPDPPKPMSEFITPGFKTLAFRPDLESRRADHFYLQDEPVAEDNTTYVSWRCEELRQGVSYELPVLVVADKLEARGALKVRASGALIAKPAELTAPLVAASSPSSERFCTYLSRHIELLPQKFQKACDTALEALATNCTCDNGG